MSDMDRRAFVGAAAVGGVAAAVLAASSAMAAGQTGYFVIAEIVSKKDKADDLRALLVPFAEKSAKEPGCLVYTLMEVIGEPGRFLTFERWTDKACPRWPHGYAGDQGQSCQSWSPFWRSRSLSFSSTPRNGRLSVRPAEYHPTAGRSFRSGPETTLDR